jgi:predicted alpha/beta hydrolase family esterase
MVFIHGGGDGAFSFDSDLVSRLRDALGDAQAIEYPHIEGLEQIEWQQAHSQLTESLCSSPQRTAVVAHSIGAAAVLKLLVNRECNHVANAFLLAPPYKAADSHWGIDDFTFPIDFASCLPRDTAIAIYHSNDDDIIPVSDALAYCEKLAAAKVSLFRTGGHQFTGVIDTVADDILEQLHGALHVEDDG